MDSATLRTPLPLPLHLSPIFCRGTVTGDLLTDGRTDTGFFKKKAENLEGGSSRPSAIKSSFPSVTMELPLQNIKVEKICIESKELHYYSKHQVVDNVHKESLVRNRNLNGDEQKLLD